MDALAHTSACVALLSFPKFAATTLPSKLAMPCCMSGWCDRMVFPLESILITSINSATAKMVAKMLYTLGMFLCFCCHAVRCFLCCDARKCAWMDGPSQVMCLCHDFKCADLLVIRSSYLMSHILENI